MKLDYKMGHDWEYCNMCCCVFNGSHQDYGCGYGVNLCESCLDEFNMVDDITIKKLAEKFKVIDIINDIIYKIKDKALQNK